MNILLSQRQGRKTKFAGFARAPVAPREEYIVERSKLRDDNKGGKMATKRRSDYAVDKPIRGDARGRARLSFSPPQ